MTLGQKIKKLRSEKGFTQKDLADQIHVAFQTISKWENDENEPDLATIRQMAKLFDCSIEYLVNEDAEQSKNEEVIDTIEANKLEEEKPQERAPQTIIIHQKDLPICAKCGKEIEEEDLVSEDVTKRERVGKITRSVSVGQTYYHRSCLYQVKKERERKAILLRAARASKAKKICFGWGIAAGLVALGIALAIFLNNQQYVHPGLGVLYSVLIGYGIFAMIYCILSGSYIASVFIWCARLTVRFPGIIFSWSLEGFVFLIAMKILFAILGFLIGLFALLFAVALSATLGGISFPFVLIHNNNNDYDDALFGN